MTDWIEGIESAWTGHRVFAEWLVGITMPSVIVDLGVDAGYSSFVFANALKNTGLVSGTVYGVDLFTGDNHTGSRDTYTRVVNYKNTHDMTNFEIIKDDFTSLSNKWTIPIDILHIDGYHTEEAVSNDYNNWNRFVKDNGIILFHDVCIPYFGVKDFFRKLDHGYKLYFTHSAGLGIVTKNKMLYDSIINNFNNVYDFNKNPF